MKTRFGALIVFSMVLLSVETSFALSCKDLFRPTGTASGYAERFGSDKKHHKPTSGIEVEGMIPREVGIQNMAEATHQFLTASGYRVRKGFSWKPVTQIYDTPTFHLRWRNEKDQEYELKIMMDYSVAPEKGYRAVEVVSPILRNRKDTEEFLQIIEMFRDMGLKHEVNRAGVHIHVGVPKLTSSELGYIGWAFSLFEGKLREIIDISPYRAPYIKTQPKAEREAYRSLGAAFIGVKEFVAEHYPERFSRYVGVNMAALKKFGTIEVRLFNSSVNPRVIRFAKHLSRKIIYHARNKTEKFMEFVERAEKEEVDILELVEVLGMNVTKAREVIEIMAQEKASQPMTPWKMRLRHLRRVPIHFLEGTIRGRILRKKAPEGWENWPQGKMPLSEN